MYFPTRKEFKPVTPVVYYTEPAPLTGRKIAVIIGLIISIFTVSLIGDAHGTQHKGCYTMPARR